MGLEWSWGIEPAPAQVWMSDFGVLFANKKKKRER